MSPLLVNILMAVGTAVATGGLAALAAYYATQKAVAVALAELKIEIKWIKEQQAEHRKDDNEKFSEHGVRILAIERGYPARHQR